MASALNWITSSSSVLIRILCYVFFRWIPGHHVPILLSSLFPVYAISYWISFFRTPIFEVLEDDTSVYATTTAEPGSLSEHSSEQSTPSQTTDGLIVEEIGVEETLLVEQKDPQLLRSLLIGTPGPYWLQSVLTFALNTTLVLGVIDLTYRGAIFYDSQELSFARVGYVSDTIAKLLVREPDSSQLPLYLSYRYADTSDFSIDAPTAFEGAWKSAGYIRSLSPATDFTATLTVDELQPDTRYQFAFSNNRSGHFITAPPNGKISERFTADEKFTFLHTSCIKSHFPYNPFDHPLSIRGFKLLAPWLRKLRPAFMMFLGDFIYIDVPRRLGDDSSTYRREYRQVYSSPDWASAASTGPTAEAFASYDIPWLHVYDDHEIENDWAQNTTGVFSAAFDPFNHYHLTPNPPYPKTKGSSNHPLGNPTYTSFIQGPAAFFMMDTRRYRNPPNCKDPYDWKITMLGVRQRTALLEWLREPVPPGVFWKIVISSVPFTKNWRVNSADGWAGYLYERQVILEEMWRVSTTAARMSNSGQNAPQAPRVIILSGDRHEFAATAFPAPPVMAHPKSATVYEFSVSPLSMFYLPFRTYWENHKEKRVEDAWSRDICLKYLPEGNSKFGAIEIEKPTGSGQSLLRYRLFVEGKEAWSYVITAGGADENDKGRWKEGLWG